MGVPIRLPERAGRDAPRDGSGGFQVPGTGHIGPMNCSNTLFHPSPTPIPLSIFLQKREDRTGGTSGTISQFQWFTRFRAGGTARPDDGTGPQVFYRTLPYLLTARRRGYPFTGCLVPPPNFPVPPPAFLLPYGTAWTGRWNRLRPVVPGANTPAKPRSVLFAYRLLGCPPPRQI